MCIVAGITIFNESQLLGPRSYLVSETSKWHSVKGEALGMEEVPRMMSNLHLPQARRRAQPEPRAALYVCRVCSVWIGC